MTDPTHKQNDESRCGCSQCQPELMDAAPADDPQARIEQLEAQKKALVTLWNIEASVVRIEPGNVLAVGGVDYNHGIEAVERLADFREALGASAVWLFTGDIDVRAIQLNRTDETKPFFSDVDVAVESGVIKLYGDGDQLIADLPGEKAVILRDMLNDGIREHRRHSRLNRPFKKVLILAFNLAECRSIGRAKGLTQWDWEQLHNVHRQLVGTFRREVLVAPCWADDRTPEQIDEIRGNLLRTEAVMTNVECVRSHP